MALSNSVIANTTPIDSIGTETIDGKVIILHRVEPKETLYSIHNKYGVSISEISAMNPGADIGLKVGEILKIPTTKTLKKEEVIVTLPVSKEKTITKSNESPKFHSVKPGETLYGVSRLYPCSVNEIKKWNKLTNNALSVGQKLIVNNSEPAIIKKQVIQTTETLTEEKIIKEKTSEITIEEEKNMTIEKEEEEEEIVETEEKTEVGNLETNLSNDNSTSEQDTTVQLSDYDTNIPASKTVDMGGYSKNYEKGYAELLSDTDNDERYLAHHRTLPEGTILQVKNLANGKSVFVRVVDTFENDDSSIIIKLSSKAELRLGTKDTPKFLTEISYIP